MYKVIGNDGRVYGPATAAQLRLWLVQARVDSRTPVFVSGASEWTFLGLLPEFARDLAVSPPPTIPPRSGSVCARKTNTFATASVVCGALAWLCCCCFPLNLVGLILGIIALVQINTQPEKQDGQALAILGLILSALSLLLNLGFLLLNFVTHPPSVAWHVGAV